MNINPVIPLLKLLNKADYAFGANSFTGSGDFSGGAITGTTVEAETGFVCDGTPAVADGTYTVGIGTTTNGTITVKGGIIIAVQEAT
jgi:hypothetical protein